MIFDGSPVACAKSGFEHGVDLDGEHDAQGGLGIVVHLEFGVGGFGWFVLVMAVFILSQQIGATVIEFAQQGTLQLVEVMAGLVAIIVFFTWIIRRPAQQAIADFDEPELATGDGSTNGAKPSQG